MEFKSYIKTESGKIIERKIKGVPGELYILHKGMKAFVEYENHIQTDSTRATIYRIRHYTEK